MSTEWANDEIGQYAGQQWLVFDLGSHSCKVGIDGEEKPRATVAPVLYVRPNEGVVDWEDTRVWIGEGPSEGEVVSFNLLASGSLATSSNWKRSEHAAPPPLDMAIEHLFLHFVMNELREDPGTSPVLLTENAPMWTSAQRAHVARVLFEKVGVPAVAFVPALVTLALSAGAAHSLVVDLGESGVRVGVVLAGKLRSELCASSEKGARSLKRKISELIAPATLSEAGLDKALRQLVVAPSKGATATTTADDVVIDGVTLNRATRVALGELLFGSDDSESVPSLIERVLERADQGDRVLALNNVVIGGGLASLKGMRDRVRAEAASRAHHFASVLKCDPINGAFTGLTILASMDIAAASHDNYEERGTRLGFAPGLFEE